MEGVKTAGDNMTPRPGLEYISSRNDEKAATIKALVVQNEATQRELQLSRKQIEQMMSKMMDVQIDKSRLEDELRTQHKHYQELAKRVADEDKAKRTITEVEQLLSEAVRERNELSEKIAKLSESSAMAKDDPVKTVEVESKTSDNKISEKTLESTTMDKAIDNKTQDVILEVARQPKSVRHLPAVADADMEPQYRKKTTGNSIQPRAKRLSEAERAIAGDDAIGVMELKAEIAQLKSTVQAQEYDLDELRVINIKGLRRNDVVEKALDQMTVANKVLTESEARLIANCGELTAKTENLKAKLNGITDELTTLQATFSETTITLEAVTANNKKLIEELGALTKEKKKLQNNLTIISKARNELAEQNTAMEEAAKKHEKDYAELALRMSETLKEYEIKLAQKDEQMVSLGNKLADASDVKLAPPPVAPPVVPVQLPVVSEEFENKWRSKEAKFVKEIESLKATLENKDLHIESLAQKIAELKNTLYEPRMIRLKTLEEQLKSHVEEYAVIEETMETAFLCTRCTAVMKNPMTLMPCGHTYCRTCADDMREENYNVEKCQECPETVVEHRFRNEQLERLGEFYRTRKSTTVNLLEWLKNLNLE